LLEDAELFCSYCRAVKMDNGEWDRLMSVDQRAYNLSRSGSKSKQEYKERLTRGSLPESNDSDAGPSGRVEDTGKSW
jgi:Zn-finger nucleic acid-binding protein